MKGRVVSIKMNNTAVVLVTGTKRHNLYKKTFTRSSKFLADDQIHTKLGDIVEIVETRPISKRKYWKVVKVIGRDIAEIVAEELKEKAAEQIAEVMPEEGSDEIRSNQNASESEDQKSDAPTNTETPISSDLSEKPKRVRKEKK